MEHLVLDLLLWLPQGQTPKDSKTSKSSIKRDLDEKCPTLDVLASIGFKTVHNERVSRHCSPSKRSKKTDRPVPIARMVWQPGSKTMLGCGTWCCLLAELALRRWRSPSCFSGSFASAYAHQDSRDAKKRTSGLQFTRSGKEQQHCSVHSYMYNNQISLSIHQIQLNISVPFHRPELPSSATQ